MFLGFDIWRQLVVKEEEKKSLEESSRCLEQWPGPRGEGGAGLGVSTWGGESVSELRRGSFITGWKAWQW